ncbi:unnamed protein product [Mucor fragilis]
MKILELPVDVLQQILCYLDERSKQAFASANNELWSKTTRFKSTKLLLLTDRFITAYQLNTTTAIKIQNIHYTPNFVNHVARYASSLKVVRMMAKNKYSQAFRSTSTIWAPAKVLLDTDDDDFTPNVDRVLTPEHVKRELERLKRQLKADHVQQMQSYQTKNNPSYELPCYLNRHWPVKDYKLIQKDLRLRDSTLTPVAAKRAAKRIGSQLVDSIIVLNGHFFVITSSSVFLHRHDSIDDCATKSSIGFQDIPVAYIRKNKRYTYDYFELSVRIGHFEVLATGGFWGSLDGFQLVPFLGSAISSLPTVIKEDVDSPHTNTIFVNCNPSEQPVITTRIMNQYLKSHSTKKWAFHSSKFHSNEFFPANPLALSSKSPYLHASSLLVRSYAYKSVEKELLTLSLPLPKSNLQQKILSLVQFTRSNFTKAITLTEQQTLHTRSDLIQIYNECLANALKSRNRKKEENAKAKFKIERVNLFD